MSAQQPSKGIGIHRSSRTRALEIGTDKRGFDNDHSYFPQGGHPILPGMPATVYQETPEHVGGSSIGSIETPNPIKK